jgi:LytS/YehU family sensor histidine kinase
MGLPIALAATIAEVLVAGWSRWLAAPVLVVAMLIGAVAGALLVIPYYDSPVETAFDVRFVSDVAYWMIIAAGIALLYELQQRAGIAAAAVHQAQLDQIALSKQMLEAQLQVMRAQIEPHFLFNTLANVKRLTQTDIHGGVTMLDNLIHYLRAALPRMREEGYDAGPGVGARPGLPRSAPDPDGGPFALCRGHSAELRSEPFPPMMLLTLVENAVKHGLNPSPHGGDISVRAQRVGPGFMLSVADTGVGFGVAATGGTGVGLANTRARLTALYGDAASLELAPNEPSGVVATVLIPHLPAGTVAASNQALAYGDPG